MKMRSVLVGIVLISTRVRIAVAFATLNARGTSDLGLPAKTVICKSKSLSVENESFASDVSSLQSHTISVTKPLGIILEQNGEKEGVVVAEILPEGSAATSSANICVRDRILSVGDTSTAEEPLETVMSLIQDSSVPTITLEIGRNRGATVVQFPNGIGVAAEVGEYVGNLAYEAKYQVEYSCRSGSCGTCEQACQYDQGSTRFIRPCVALVPSGRDIVKILPTESSGRLRP